MEKENRVQRKGMCCFCSLGVGGRRQGTYWQHDSGAEWGTIQTNTRSLWKWSPEKGPSGGSNLRGVAGKGVQSEEVCEMVSEIGIHGAGWDRPLMTWCCTLSLWQTLVRW